MKRYILIITLCVLALTTTANAGLLISVDGIVNPPDSEIALGQTEIASIGIYGDGLTEPSQFLLGIFHSGSSGSMDISNAQILYTGDDTGIEWLDDIIIAGYLGVENPIILITLNHIGPVEPKPLLQGSLVEDIIFMPGEYGDVLLGLFTFEGIILDTQVLHYLPEPGTLAVLMFGTLLGLRKRRRF